MPETTPLTPINTERVPQNIKFIDISEMEKDEFDDRILIDRMNITTPGSTEVIGALILVLTHGEALPSQTTTPIVSNLISATLLDFYILPEYQGKGFGLGSYISLINRIATLYKVPLMADASNLSGTPADEGIVERQNSYGAYHLWLSLVKRGLAHPLYTKEADDNGKGIIGFISIPDSVRDNPELINQLEKLYELSNLSNPDEVQINTIQALREVLFPETDK